MKIFSLFGVKSQLNIMKPYKSETAGKDHDDDEGLEVGVFHQFERVKPPAAPYPAEQSLTEGIHPQTFGSTRLRTAVVRILKQISHFII